MKVLIVKASDWEYRKIKEINNLKDLLRIYKNLIVSTDKETISIYAKKDEEIDCVVTIYDDYVE